LLAAVDAAAAVAGLAPGMPLADALSFAPGLATRPAEPEQDQAALLRLAEWCGRYSPWTAPDGEAGVKLDISGCAHLWGGEAELAADLTRRLARQAIAHRIAIAGTLGAAWALAHFGTADRVVAIPERVRDALAPLPVEALRLDPATAAGLRRVGLRHVGELLPMPRAALARRFGGAVAHRLDQLDGTMPEPLSPLGEAPTRRVRLSFAEPIADPDSLAVAAERLAGDLTAWMAREGVGARRLDLGFHRVDGRVEHIRLGTARPSRDPAHLARLLTARLDTIDPGLGVEDMILAVYAVEKLGAEQVGFAGDAAMGDGIAPLADRLAAQLEPGALARLEPRESHLPERASVAVPIGDNGNRKSEVIPGRPAGANPEPMNATPAGDASTAFFKSRGAVSLGSGFAASQRPGMTSERIENKPHKPPRPVRLFQPPEPVEAFWLLPDDPPFHFAWRRRPHRVAQADGPERVAEEWWQPGEDSRREDVMQEGAIRDYYRVEDEEGRRFWLFRAGLPGHDNPPRWYVHGVFA
jgi:protein ImuB